MTRKFWLASWSWQFLSVTLALLVLLTSVGTTRAETKTWNAGTADWNTAGNWSPAGVPTNADDAVINNGGTAQISTNDAAANTLTVGDSATGNVQQTSNGLGVAFQLVVGKQAGSTGAYTLSGTGVLTGAQYIGWSGTGTFTQNGGTNGAGGLFLGYSTGGSGTYNLNSGILTSIVSQYIGYGGTGVFTQEGGINSTNRLELGVNNGSTGTYNLNAGTLAVDTFLQIGISGTGTLTQKAGTTATVSQDLYLGYDPPLLGNPGGRGTYNLQGGTLTAQAEYIGYSGTGTFNHGMAAPFAGTNTGPPIMDMHLYLGYNSTGNGTYNLGGTGTLTAQTEYIGYSGTGIFNQSGGTNSAGVGGWRLGYNTGANGTYNLSGTGSLSGQFGYVGYSGTGLFQQSGGTNSVGGLYLGRNSGASGTYNLSGSGSLSASAELIGFFGTGIFNQSGGTNSAGVGGYYLGYNTGANGTYNLSGTGSLSATNEYIGESGTGTFIQDGGTNTITGELNLGHNPLSSGTYELRSGSLSAGFMIVGDWGSGTFTQSGGTNSVGGLILGKGMAVGSGTYNLSGTGSLAVGSNLYVGHDSPGIFIQTGGTNTVTGNMQISNNSAYKFLGGSLSVGGNYTQNAGGTLEIGIASAASYGNFGVGGTASLAGTMRPVLQGGYIPDYGQVFNIITATGGRFGTFDTLADQQITPIKSWDPIYNANSFDLQVLADFTPAGVSLTPNQQAVGNMLDEVAGSATGDLNDVLNAIGNLPTGGSIADAYQQISPDKAAALPNLGFAAGKLSRQILGQRITDLRFGGREMEMAGGFPGSLSLFGSKTSGTMLAYNGASLAGMAPAKRRGAAPESRWGLWFDPAGVLGNQKTTINQTGYDFSIVGFNAGVDYRVQDNVLVGLTTGYSYTDADFKGSGGSVTSSTWPITAYAAYLPETWYAFGSLGYALNLFDLERQLSFGGLTRTAKSSPTGHQFNAYGEAGYDFKLAPFVLTPTVSLAYSYISVESFTESGAGSLSLKVGSQNADSLQTGVGAKVAVPLKGNSCTVVPQVYATYQHEFLNDSRGLNAALSGAGSTFAFTTDNPGRDFAVVGGNVTVFKNNLSGYVNYNAEVGRSKYTAHYIGAGLRYQF